MASPRSPRTYFSRATVARPSERAAGEAAGRKIPDGVANGHGEGVFRLRTKPPAFAAGRSRLTYLNRFS